MDVDIPYQTGSCWKGLYFHTFDVQHCFELAILHAIAVENTKTAVDVEVSLLFNIFSESVEKKLIGAWLYVGCNFRVYVFDTFLPCHLC